VLAGVLAGGCCGGCRWCRGRAPAARCGADAAGWGRGCAAEAAGAGWVAAGPRPAAGAACPGSACAKAVPRASAAPAAPPAIHSETRRVRASRWSRRAAALLAGIGMPELLSVVPGGARW